MTVACGACGETVSSTVGCGKADCPYPQNPELREKVQAYRRRFQESAVARKKR